ncbi:MAG: ribonucleotide reductase N-terminal alpha domain-containing protein [Clostridiales bacterium]|nr:ribonucleotide reductase N-terminal alpha domain-containing protein [Clostridiales bacterium]HBM80849.1 ribonucleotide reductase [Clostridiaceae bacterium]
MALSKNAIKVLEKRYLSRDAEGNVVETPEGMFRRVASTIAKADERYGKSDTKALEDSFYKMMVNLEFIPNSPTLMNTGKDLGQLSACFVLPVEDSMEGIFDAVKNAALIHKSGGGTGFSFSRLRPQGAVVRTTGGVASGPISFIKVFNAATEAVKQGGRRRGANMAILRVDHPDILDFIQCKKQNSDITNFNISVGITEEFMKAVESGEDYNLVDPHTKKVTDRLNAKKVFDLIVDMAWNNGEPGIVFLDRLNRDNPTPGLGEIESTNPCVTGDTLVETENGKVRIDSIKEASILSIDRKYYKASAFKTGIKPVYLLKVKGGYEIKLTADHKIMTISGWKAAGDLCSRDMIKVLNGNEFMYSEFESLEYLKEEEVYDITEEVNHLFIANNIVVHNCGEQPLLPYESCNLGSINVSKMVKRNGSKTEVNYERLGEVVDLAVHFLDNVINVNRYPLKKIEEMTKKTRKIGLGIMGFADLLIELGIPYNSDEGVEFAENLMKFINDKSKETSRKLGKIRGAFPAIEDSIYKGDVIRNATTTTIAPTGTISIIAGCSSGIEPLFAISYVRNVMDNNKLVEVHPVFEEAAKKRGIYTEELMREIAKAGSLSGLDVPEDMKKVFVTAHDIDPYWHIKMQSAFQKHTDNAVSKTVNFRHDATRDDVREVFMLAYKLGCKGVTIYRDGSRDTQVLNIGGTEKKEGHEDFKIVPRQRPEITTGITEKVRVGCGSLYITVNYDDNGICEVFTNVGKAGGCPSQSEAASRLISIALRSGIDVKEIIGQLKGIRCHSTIRQKANNKDIKVLSCPDAIAKTIERVMNLQSSSDKYDSEVSEEDGPDISPLQEVSIGLDDKKGPRCPECGGHITHQDGCVICPSCGYSKCH